MLRLIRIFSKATWRRITVAFALFVIPAFLFVKLADRVRDQETLQLDKAVLHAVNATTSPQLDVLMAGVSQFGGVVGVLALTAGAVALLWGRRMRRMATLLACGVGGAAVLNVLLKAFFQRDRPELWERLVAENSYSFPSGHAMASSALALSLIVIFWPTQWRWLVVALGGLYTLVIGYTRLYLGVHYPSDVGAGWLVSAAWVALVSIAIRYRPQRGSTRQT